MQHRWKTKQSSLPKISLPNSSSNTRKFKISQTFKQAKFIAYFYLLKEIPSEFAIHSGRVECISFHNPTRACNRICIINFYVHLMASCKPATESKQAASNENTCGIGSDRTLPCDRRLTSTQALVPFGPELARSSLRVNEK